MAVKNNAVLGYYDCGDCGERATVHKTARGKSRYLYKRCGCGCDQRTGKKVQHDLFFKTEWLDGAPEPPPNVDISQKVVEPEKAPVVELEKEPEKSPEKKGDFPFIVTVASGAVVFFLALIGR